MSGDRWRRGAGCAKTFSAKDLLRPPLRRRLRCGANPDAFRSGSLPATSRGSGDAFPLLSGKGRDRGEGYPLLAGKRTSGPEHCPCLSGEATEGRARREGCEPIPWAAASSLEKSLEVAVC